MPRSSYPEGRAAYLRWRTALKKQHAEEVAAILAEVGYDEATIDRVQRIIRKEGLGTDPAVQTHEDALCLVFLETQLAATVDDLGDEKMLDVIRKTAAKMSDRALGLVGDLPMRPRRPCPRRPGPRRRIAVDAVGGPPGPPAIVAGSRGRGSAGRAQPCQGWGRGFESRRPLQNRRSGALRGEEDRDHPSVRSWYSAYGG